MSSSPHDPIDADLLDRYLARLTSRDESDQVERWIAAHPDRAVMVETLRTLPLGPGDGEVATDSDAWLARLSLRTPARGTVDAGRRWPSHTVVHRSRIVWYTVALVVACVGALLVGHGTLGRTLWQFGRRGAARTTVYATGNGERANITLPDGSIVALNVASRLEVPTDFGGGNRTLRLSGEALFTTVHSHDAPFVVRTGATTTRVLGTTFAVRWYDTDTAVTVMVSEGKVSVHHHVVTDHQQVVVGRDGAVHVAPANLSALSFATGVLTFDDVPLRDAIVDLDRWYDADIRLGDPHLASAHLRASFKAGSITDLGAMLEFIFGVHVVRNGRVLTLNPRA